MRPPPWVAHTSFKSADWAQRFRAGPRLRLSRLRLLSLHQAHASQIPSLVPSTYCSLGIQHQGAPSNDLRIVPENSNQSLWCLGRNHIHRMVKCRPLLPGILTFLFKQGAPFCCPSSTPPAQDNTSEALLQARGTSVNKVFLNALVKGVL